MNGEILTLKEVSEYLRVHPATVYKMARVGEIPCFKLGKSWRFRKDSIDEWSRAVESQNSVSRRAENKVF
ncbi:MAG: helix-turn-helix domain-containing protein [Candidatus Omnitrophica bacterium]|nr:helix-turn-helix domain-containing protein [Candidatus Omnitrophota bacterium]